MKDEWKDYNMILFDSCKYKVCLSHPDRDSKVKWNVPARYV